VFYEHPHFFEASFINEDVNSLSRGQFSLLVLIVDSLLTAAEKSCLAQFSQFFNSLRAHVHTLSSMDTRWQYRKEVLLMQGLMGCDDSQQWQGMVALLFLCRISRWMYGKHKLQVSGEMW
jgi:hypothetical protein